MNLKKEYYVYHWKTKRWVSVYDICLLEDELKFLKEVEEGLWINTWYGWRKRLVKY